MIYFFFQDVKEEVSRNDDIEIQIVRVTSNQDDSGLKGRYKIDRYSNLWHDIYVDS